MRFKYVVLSTAAAAMLALLSPAQASSWSVISPTNSPISLGGTTSVYYSPSAADSIWYYNGNVSGGQSTANIQSTIETQFNLTSGTLTNVSGCDSPTSGCTGGSGGNTSSGHYTNTFISNFAYDYLAIHFGDNELLFHWSTPIAAGTLFEIGGLPKGLSNYRAYSSDISPVPLPSAAWLFGSALLGFTMVSSRKRV